MFRPIGVSIDVWSNEYGVVVVYVERRDIDDIALRIDDLKMFFGIGSDSVCKKMDRRCVDGSANGKSLTYTAF